MFLKKIMRIKTIVDEQIKWYFFTIFFYLFNKIDFFYLKPYYFFEKLISDWYEKVHLHTFLLNVFSNESKSQKS